MLNTIKHYEIRREEGRVGPQAESVCHGEKNHIYLCLLIDYLFLSLNLFVVCCNNLTNKTILFLFMTFFLYSHTAKHG